MDYHRSNSRESIDEDSQRAQRYSRGVLFDSPRELLVKQGPLEDGESADEVHLRKEIIADPSCFFRGKIALIIL